MSTSNLKSPRGAKDVASKKSSGIEEWIETCLAKLNDEITLVSSVTTDFFELDPKRGKSDTDSQSPVFLVLGRHRLYIFRSSDSKKNAKLAVHYLDIMQIVSVRPSEVFLGFGAFNHFSWPLKYEIKKRLYHLMDLKMSLTHCFFKSIKISNQISPVVTLFRDGL
jgi:hypothetical protein